MHNPSHLPDDQPAVRARVPDHVAGGQLSTGVIIVTGPMEFLLDFVRSLPRPNAIVSRIVLPHGVMPQFIQALEKNLEMYRQRFGPVPGEAQSTNGLVSKELHPTALENNQPATSAAPPIQLGATANPSPSISSGPGNSAPKSPVQEFGQPIDVHPGSPLPPTDKHELPNADQRGSKTPNPQDIYDELKLRDELLSGTYANAVMIGHGQYEYNFDFITNFYPQSAVSARVFMAVGHVPRMLESLKASWEQIRPRFPGMGGS